MDHYVHKCRPLVLVKCMSSSWNAEERHDGVAVRITAVIALILCGPLNFPPCPSASLCPRFSSSFPPIYPLSLRALEWVMWSHDPSGLSVIRLSEPCANEGIPSLAIYKYQHLPPSLPPQWESAGMSRSQSGSCHLQGEPACHPEAPLKSPASRNTCSWEGFKSTRTGGAQGAQRPCWEDHQHGFVF